MLLKKSNKGQVHILHDWISVEFLKLKKEITNKHINSQYKCPNCKKNLYHAAKLNNLYFIRKGRLLNVLVVSVFLGKFYMIWNAIFGFKTLMMFHKKVYNRHLRLFNCAGGEGLILDIWTYKYRQMSKLACKGILLTTEKKT